MNPTHLRRSLAALLATTLASVAVLADPEPAPAPTTGASADASVAVEAPERPMAPAFACEGTSGATRRLTDYLGRAVIVVYEDRDSNHQNDVLKQELAARANAQDLTRDVSVVPVANLSGFDFWPARGYARDAVVEIAREQRMEILIDWTGAMARAYRFRPGVSYVMVLSREGRVLFRHAGTLNSGARRSFFNAVAEAIGQR